MNTEASEATCVPAQETHYTVQQISKQWQFSRRTVIRIFENEPGVLVRGKGESRYKKKYFTMRVPKSVMIRVHEKLSRPQ